MQESTGGGQETSLREAKRRATARALAQTAFDLAMERGVDGFTIEDVTTRAGYSRRTFANHYGDKEQAIVGVAVERVRDALTIGPDDDLPLLEWLRSVAQRQLSGGLLTVLRDLRVLAEDHPAIRRHLLEVQRDIREAAREAILARVEGRRGTLYAHLVVGAAYGALSCVLDGYVPVRLAPSPDGSVDGSGPEPGAAMTVDEFVDLTFAHLRDGFDPASS